MSYELIELQYAGDFATITMNNPKRRNALSLKHMLELTDAFREVGESTVLGVTLAANGPAFSAGHDLADIVGQDLVAMRHILRVCTTLMETIQAIPQPVLHCYCSRLPAGGNMRPCRCLHRSVLCDAWGTFNWLVLYNANGSSQPQYWAQACARNAVHG